MISGEGSGVGEGLAAETVAERDGAGLPVAPHAAKAATQAKAAPHASAAAVALLQRDGDMAASSCDSSLHPNLIMT